MLDFFFKSVSYIYELLGTKFFGRFLDFSQFFDRNLAKITALIRDECENYVASLKIDSILPQKCSKKRQIGPIHGTQCVFELCAPRTHSSPNTEGDKPENKPKKTNITFTHVQPVRVLRSVIVSYNNYNQLLSINTSITCETHSLAHTCTVDNDHYISIK